MKSLHKSWDIEHPIIKWKARSIEGKSWSLRLLHRCKGRLAFLRILFLWDLLLSLCNLENFWHLLFYPSLNPSSLSFVRFSSSALEHLALIHNGNQLKLLFAQKMHFLILALNDGLHELEPRRINCLE